MAKNSKRGFAHQPRQKAPSSQLARLIGVIAPAGKLIAVPALFFVCAPGCFR